MPSRVLVVVLDLKELLVSQVRLVLQDPWELLVLVEMKESKVLLDLLAVKEPKETKESQVCQDCVDQEENLELKERLVLRELKDQEDLPVPWAHKDNKDLRYFMKYSASFFESHYTVAPPPKAPATKASPPLWHSSKESQFQSFYF